jgi:hypothetical protein
MIIEFTAEVEAGMQLTLEMMKAKLSCCLNKSPIHSWSIVIDFRATLASLLKVNR